MEFIQQNKLFAAVVGIALLALIVLWPSLFGLGPTIVSLDRSRYERAMMDQRSIKGKVEQFFPKTGKAVVPIKRAVQDVEASNRLLLSNLDEMRGWLTSVPRYPFRIPETRKDAERNAYVSLAYTYLLTGELSCDECTIADENDGVVSLAGNRKVPLRDPFFGMQGMAIPGAIKDPDIRIMQVALVHDLGHLAIRLKVDEITTIVPAEPYKVRVGEADLAMAYPVNVRIRCDVPTLLAFLHALDGAHGRVAKAAGGPPAAAVRPEKAPEAEEPGEAIKPLPPKPKPKAAGDDAEDPGPGPAAPIAGDGHPPASAPPAQLQKLVIHLVGSPSLLAPDAAPGAFKERFTIFRRDPANPQKFLFIANALATKVLDPGSPKLTPDSIVNWRALCTRLKAQADEREPNVGKRLWDLLSPGAQGAVTQAAEGKDLDDAAKAEIVSSINDAAFGRADFYHPEDFANVPLPPEADALLKLDPKLLTPAKRHKLHRLLLQAAYPNQIAKPSIKLEAVVEAGSDRVLQPEGKEPARNLVREDDLAATRFFFVRNLKLKSNPGAIARGSEGFPSDVTPPHLEADLAVAALTLLEVQVAKPVEKRPTGTDPTILPRGF